MKQITFLYNNSFANNFMDKNSSREESNKIFKITSNKYISSRNRKTFYKYL